MTYQTDQLSYYVVEQQDLLPEFTFEEFVTEAAIFTSLDTPFLAESYSDAVRKHVYTTYDVDMWDHNGELQEGVKIVFKVGPDRFVLVPWTYDPSPHNGKAGTITVGEVTNSLLTIE